MDKIKLAHKKNRIGEARLKAEINRIDREHGIEMRQHNNSRQRFKNKWAKLDVFNENNGVEASDVVMYETHNPGFCYKRNGECRVQQSNITNSSVNMKDLDLLLFTNDEIDIDKVLCLYLLTAHGTDSLTPPPRFPSFLAKQQSPLERLVERSKRKDFQIKLFHKKLPLYILDVKTDGKAVLTRDQRLLSKIIINSKILQIVNSVKTALEVSNTETLTKLLTIASNIDLIKAVISKPKMLSYIKTLYGQNLISSCESFYMEPVQNYKIQTLQIDVEPLEDFVGIIRSNILQMPNTKIWNEFYAKSSSEISLETTITNLTSEHSIFNNENEEIRSVSTIPSSVRSVETVEDFDFLFETEEIPRNTKNSYIPKMQPKILKNMQKGFSKVGTEADVFSLISSKKKPPNINYHDLANLLSQKVEKESKKEYHKVMSETPEIVQETIKIKNTPNTSPRFSLRQTTCDACLNRWREPLPEPKLSKLKKIPLPVLKDTSYFSSKSAQRVSKLIDEEVQKFENSEKSAIAAEKNNKFSNRIYKNIANKGNYYPISSIEIVDLDELELAKVRQKIRESETQKKYDIFMKNHQKL